MNEHMLRAMYLRLFDLTRTMKVKGRGRELDVEWFLKHGAVLNKQHPDFKEAYKLATEIIKRISEESK